MNRFSFAATLSLFILICSSTSVFGHGDIHKRIKETTKEIQAARDSAYLYVKRGELYIQHEDYKKALRDFSKAKKLGYNNLILKYNQALAHFHLKKFDKSLVITESILETDLNYVRAHRLKGRTMMRLQRYDDAAFSYETVIELASQRLPENYFEASLAWQKAQHSDSYNKSIDYLLKGISDLGPLISFYNQLVHLATNQNDLKNALIYQTQIIDLSDRKERAYYNRGMTHLELDDHDSALADFVHAKESMDRLNQRILNQKPSKELRSLIDEQLSSQAIEAQ